MQRDLGTTEMSVDLGGGLSMPLKKMPAGEFVMGDVDGYGNEYPDGRGQDREAILDRRDRGEPGAVPAV